MQAQRLICARPGLETTAGPPLICSTLTMDRLLHLCVWLRILLELNPHMHWRGRAGPCGFHSLPHSAGISQKLLGIAQFLAKRYRGFHSLRDPSTPGHVRKPLQTFLVFFSHSFPFLFSFVTFSTEVAIHGETISKDQFLFITRTDYVILAWDRGLEGIAKPEKLEPWPLR